MGYHRAWGSLLDFLYDELDEAGDDSSTHAEYYRALLNRIIKILDDDSWW